MWYECVHPNTIGGSKGIHWNLNSLYMSYKEWCWTDSSTKGSSLKIDNDDWRVHTHKDSYKDRQSNSAYALVIAANGGIMKASTLAKSKLNREN